MARRKKKSENPNDDSKIKQHDNQSIDEKLRKFADSIGIKRAVKDKRGKIIAYEYHKGKSKTVVPLDMVEFYENSQRVLLANSDFNGVISEITKEPIERKELDQKLTILMKEMQKLSSFESMSSKGQDELLAKARKAINLFLENYETIAADKALKRFEADFLAVGKALNQYTHINKELKLPNLKEYRKKLLNPKMMDLEHYTYKMLSMYRDRITHFDLNRNGNVEKELANYIARDFAKNTSGTDFYTKIDELMTMLDKHYPTGYINIPVVRVTKTHGVTVNAVKRLDPRKMALDYYLKVWLQDVEATIHNSATQAAYMQVGIDLVEIKNTSGSPCPICERDVGKIFSLSGNDPDFRICPNLPRHPNCDCYSTPVLDEEFWKTAEDVKWDYNDEDEVRRNIKNGTFNMGIVSVKQNRHIVGTKEYVEGKSILTANPREILDKYAGSGKIMIVNNQWIHKERIYCDEVIGFHKNQNGVVSETKIGMIHYSKKGVHIVPAKEPDTGGE